MFVQRVPPPSGLSRREKEEGLGSENIETEWDDVYHRCNTAWAYDRMVKQGMQPGGRRRWVGGGAGGREDWDGRRAGFRSFANHHSSIRTQPAGLC